MKNFLFGSLLILSIFSFSNKANAQWQIVQPHYEICPDAWWGFNVLMPSNGWTFTFEVLLPIGQGFWYPIGSTTTNYFHISGPGTYRVSFGTSSSGTIGSQVFTVSEAPPSGLYNLNDVTYCQGNAPSMIGYHGLNINSIDIVNANWFRNGQYIAQNTTDLVVPFQGDGLYSIQVTTSSGCEEQYWFNVNESSGTGLNALSDVEYCGALTTPSVVGWEGIDPSTVDVSSINWYYDYGNPFFSQLFYTNVLNIPFIGQGTYKAVVTSSDGCVEEYVFTVNDICCPSWTTSNVITNSVNDYAQISNGPNQPFSYTGTEASFKASHWAVTQLPYVMTHWEVNDQSGNQIPVTLTGLNVATFPTIQGMTYDVTLNVFDNGVKCEKYINSFQWQAPVLRGGGRKSMEISEEINEKAEIKAYPNPSSGEFNITLPNIENTIIVFDMTGAKVKEIKASGNSLLDLSDQVSGMYLVQVININGVEQLKLNLQK